MSEEVGHRSREGRRRRVRREEPAESKEQPEPGGEDPGDHPFDKEVHPADNTPKPGERGKRSPADEGAE